MLARAGVGSVATVSCIAACQVTGHADDEGNVIRRRLRPMSLSDRGALFSANQAHSMMCSGFFRGRLAGDNRVL